MKKNGTAAGIRTPNLLIRSQVLYPVELRLHRRDAESTERGFSLQAAFVTKKGTAFGRPLEIGLRGVV